MDELPIRIVFRQRNKTANLAAGTKQNGSTRSGRDCCRRQIKITRLSFAAWMSMLLLITISQPGCQLFSRFKSQPVIASPVAFTELPSKEQIVQHLSNQTERVSQLQTDVKVSIAGMPSLRGTLAVEKPDRLRMNAGLLGVTELGIDVGSNENVFWFWTKVAAPGEEPGIYYANHDQYRNSALQRTIPIEPGWIIDSLGLVKFEPTDRIEGPHKRPDGRLELWTFRKVANQTTLRKTVIDAQYGWVNQQSIYDSTGRLLAYANSIKHQHYPEYGISLPSRIDITALNPDGSELKLSLNASRFRINSIYGDPDKLWSMPNPGDVPLIDLVNGPQQTNSTSFDRTSSFGSNIHDHRTSSNVGDHNQSFINQIK